MSDRPIWKNERTLTLANGQDEQSTPCEFRSGRPKHAGGYRPSAPLVACLPTSSAFRKNGVIAPFPVLPTTIRRYRSPHARYVCPSSIGIPLSATTSGCRRTSPGRADRWNSAVVHAQVCCGSLRIPLGNLAGQAPRDVSSGSVTTQMEDMTRRLRCAVFVGPVPDRRQVRKDRTAAQSSEQKENIRSPRRCAANPGRAGL